MKSTIILLLLTGCASYHQPLTSTRLPYIEHEDEYSASIAPKQLGIQRPLNSNAGSLLTTAIMGVNLYRNISALNSNMINEEINARIQTMVSNPSELFNSLYP